MKIGIRKLNFNLSGKDFEQILSGEVTEILRPVNASWRKKVLHPKTLDYYRIYLLSVSTGREETRKALRFSVENLEIRWVKNKENGQPEEFFVFKLIG